MPVITLIPGLACDAQLWREQAAALAPLGPVRVADVHTRFATLPEMAAALLAETDGDLHLVGTSMGGMVALEVARQAPQRVRSLALLATSARPDTPELLQLRRDAIVLFEQGRMREVLQANVAFAFHPEHAAALAPPYLQMIERAGAGQLIAQNRAIMARGDYRPGLAAIGCPTLVVCGHDDRLTPPEHSQEIAAGIAGARLELLDDCGHLLTWEQPARVGALLLDWLRGRS
ncbi:MAG: alpha/beta fold hydrolase [Burkholderiales bacterium]|nr:alpha/beta fold hydrolase [Burkholderiales bacterium]